MKEIRKYDLKGNLNQFLLQNWSTLNISATDMYNIYVQNKLYTNEIIILTT
jgi:hypothetical protein